jgi:carbonic anhydrase
MPIGDQPLGALRNETHVSRDNYLTWKSMCQLYKNFNFHILEHFFFKKQVLHAVVHQVQQNQDENLKCIAVTVQQQYQNAGV